MRFDHLFGLAHGIGRRSETFTQRGYAIEIGEGRDEHGISLAHPLTGFFVQINSVLDGIDSAQDSVLDALGCLSVSRHPPAHPVSLLDDRLDLLRCVRGLPWIALRGIDPARDRYLDQVSAEADLLSDNPHAIVDSIDFLTQRRDIQSPSDLLHASRL